MEKYGLTPGGDGEPGAARRAGSRRDPVVVAGVMLLGALCAAVLGAVGALWGATPAGNTALVVPFAGGPAVLAAGWSFLLLTIRHREPGGRRLVVATTLEGLAALLLSLGAV